MKFGLIAKHRSIWPVVWLCEALGVSRSGFQAWLRRGPSARTIADEELATKVRGELHCQRPHLRRPKGLAGRARRRRILRPAQDRAADAGQRALGATAPSRPAEGRGRALADRGAERARQAIHGRSAEPQMDRRLHIRVDSGGLAVRRRCDRPVLAKSRRLVDEGGDDGATRHRRSHDGDLEAWQAGRAAAPLR